MVGPDSTAKRYWFTASSGSITAALYLMGCRLITCAGRSSAAILIICGSLRPARILLRIPATTWRRGISAVRNAPSAAGNTAGCLMACATVLHAVMPPKLHTNAGVGPRSKQAGKASRDRLLPITTRFRKRQYGEKKKLRHAWNAPLRLPLAMDSGPHSRRSNTAQGNVPTSTAGTPAKWTIVRSAAPRTACFRAVNVIASLAVIRNSESAGRQK